jgi:hypothetical protein
LDAQACFSAILHVAAHDFPEGWPVASAVITDAVEPLVVEALLELDLSPSHAYATLICIAENTNKAKRTKSLRDFFIFPPRTYGV